MQGSQFGFSGFLGFYGEKADKSNFFEKTLDIDAASSGIMEMVMKMKEDKHISEVCKMLHTTSRTIRYYEQLGLIAASRETEHGPRRLDEENTERLKKILFLRKIGFSLDEILEIVQKNVDVSDLIRTKKALIQAEIIALYERIRLLEEVMAAAERKDDIYSVEIEKPVYPKVNEENCRIARQCTELLVSEDYRTLAEHFQSVLQPYLTPEFIGYAWREFRKPCGAFLSYGVQTAEGNLVSSILNFEKLSITVVLGFQDGALTGLKYYYNQKKEKQSDV